MDLRSCVSARLERYKNEPYFNRNFLDQLYGKLEEDKLVKAAGTDCHLDAMFIPIYQEKDKVFIYLGNHKKANDWIPPGGHIEKGELPEDAVIREFEEELRFKIKATQIQFFNITVKFINKPDFFCMTHFDLWHFVRMKKQFPFNFLRKEYYDAGWFEIKEAAAKIKHNPPFKKTTLSVVSAL